MGAIKLAGPEDGGISTGTAGSHWRAVEAVTEWGALHHCCSAGPLSMGHGGRQASREHETPARLPTGTLELSKLHVVDMSREFAR